MKATGLSIGLVGPLPPPSGGMANQTMQLARLLADDGVTVELIQVNRPYRPAWAAHLKGIRAAFRLPAYLLHLWRAAGRVQLFHVMANSGWSWHLFAAPAIWIARLRGIAVIVNYRGGEAATFFAKSIAVVRPSLKRADQIIVPSGFLEKVFAEHGFTTQIVPNIIDLSRFSSDCSVPGHSESEAPHILVARNLEPIYDNATALRAFKIVRQTLPAARLTVAGSGPELPDLEKLADDLGIADALTFTGRVDNDNMPALYKSADLMINPSLADNMPISVLEALASGVPVVSTDVGGVPYLVEHGKTALLVPPCNPEKMAEAILAALTVPNMAQRLSRAGIESVARYTWPKVRIALLDVYHQVRLKRTQSAKETK